MQSEICLTSEFNWRRCSLCWVQFAIQLPIWFDGYWLYSTFSFHLLCLLHVLCKEICRDVEEKVKYGLERKKYRIYVKYQYQMSWTFAILCITTILHGVKTNGREFQKSSSLEVSHVKLIMFENNLLKQILNFLLI